MPEGNMPVVVACVSSTAVAPAGPSQKRNWQSRSKQRCPVEQPDAFGRARERNPPLPGYARRYQA